MAQKPTPFEQELYEILASCYEGTHGITKAQAIAEIKAAVLNLLPKVTDNEWMEGTAYDSAEAYNQAIKDITEKFK